tara:strand:+ start:912 stop:1826 length:915 start_codon:yes stop_codon:yes gene_type:complete
MRKIIFQEADFYGASKLVFNDSKIPLCYKASWMHGLGFIFHENINSRILIHYNEDFLPFHLVNNNDSSSILKKDGIKSIPVGMPFIYTKTFEKKKSIHKKYKRIFMPRHIVSKSKFIESFESWKRIVSKYSCDAICLAGLEYRMFKEQKIDFGRNISVLRGASAGDDSSLERVAQMFSSSHEIICDSIGSHLIYAGSCGASVRIIDEIYQLPKYSDQIIKNAPKKIKESFKSYYSSNILDNIESSIWASGNDNEIEEFSNYVLGIDHKKSSTEIQKFLIPDNWRQTISIIYNLIKMKLVNRITV